MSLEVKEILSLPSIRARARRLADAADNGGLNHFVFDAGRLDVVADFVVSIIKRDYGPDQYHTIPPHGRWQHFEAGGVARITSLLDAWKKAGCDKLELTRRLVDLFFVSVLLDAGAGDTWHWTEPGTDNTFERSEGIAIATLYMFENNALSGRDGDGPIVTGEGLKSVRHETLATAFQCSSKNEILGLESRLRLLHNLGHSLLAQPECFGPNGRPGCLADYLLRQADGDLRLDVLTLWDILQKVLIPIWPSDRTRVDGHPVGDAWPLRALKTQTYDQSEATSSSIQPFHKLTQWLTYSLMVPFQRLLDVQWQNAESLTALAEYRNGGLFVDLGALTLTQAALERGLNASRGELPLFTADDDAIIEWRAMTLVLVDRIYPIVLAKMESHLTLAQLLEAGTWKAGRELAAERRPKTKSSPILIDSDGTVF